ncbi:TatD family deoxyribonuclease [Chitinimonas arctica]|uniref:TatD family deoxyribonuclease n=1 Tax=Chitinimonas arctica TaxID=2594795 RepID=A0A516SL50_9NEIS|nr:TatD family hydrolase [Chitinimonas arctica]QDQ28876.1 TatD family deoxyribonuclease [Chitinimonas arctica]
MLIDTHCHLDAPEFDADRDEVVRRAREAGVHTVVVPGVTLAAMPQTLAMRRLYGCPVAFGLHPIFERTHRDAHLIALGELIASEKPVAVGEIGLDFFVEGLDRVRQTEIFAAQLKLARDFELPVLLHVRKSQDQVLKQLRRFGIRRGIAHAFNGSPQQADAYLAQGLKLGFGGTLTFERALNIRRLATKLPIEGIVLETDAPDIPPSWAASQRNEPANVAGIAALLAELRGMELGELARLTSENARKTLGLDAVAD